MLRGADSARKAVGADGGNVEVGQPGRVDHDSGYLQALQFLMEQWVQVGRDEHRAVAGSSSDVGEPLAGGPRLTMDRGDDGTHTGGVGGVLDTSHPLDGPGAVEVVEDEVDQARSLRARPAPAVTGLAQQPLDTLACAGRD